MKESVYIYKSRNEIYQIIDRFFENNGSRDVEYVRVKNVQYFYDMF